MRSRLMVVLMGLAGLAAVGCQGRHGVVLQVEETEEYRSGYYVVWPEDVMPDASAFQSELDVEGRWVTSVPRADGVVAE